MQWYRNMMKLCMALFIVSQAVWLSAQENRTFDGSRNNLSALQMGSSYTQYGRLTNEINYADGIGQVNNELPNVRDISNTLFNQTTELYDQSNLSDFVWAFGQFVCHDVDYLHYNPEEFMMVSVPAGDDFFVDETEMQFFRNKYDESTGTDIDNPREFLNHVSTWLDGSGVYGSDEERAAWLRTFENGKLKTAPGGNFLPWNTVGGDYNSQIDAEAPEMKHIDDISTKYYVAGDERSNKNPLLISLHTLFVREHNRLCDEFALRYPNWDDERIYQRARKMVGAYIQKITFDDWLPSLGILLEEYSSYDPDMDVTISNEFSAAGIVFENTLMGQDILRLDNTGDVISSGNLAVGEEFYYDPKNSSATIGIEPYIKGLATQVQQSFDTKASTNLRNFDFSETQSSKDLIAQVIFNGRDRGLMGYNSVRRNIGLPGFTNYNTLTGDAEVAETLETLYGSIENIDLWVGLLAEKKTSNATMGELIINILEKQFRRLRDGDRFYYENDTDVFNAFDIYQIKQTTLRDIILRNTSITLIQQNVFLAESTVQPPDLTKIHLNTKVYPNPSLDGNIKTLIYSDYEGEVELVVVDLFGRELYSETSELRSGNNYVNLYLQNYGIQRGYYSLLIKSKQYSNVVPFVVE